MKTETVVVPMRDGKMSAYVAYPDKKPVGAIIAIMEIWGVNDTMRHHAHEFAEAGFGFAVAVHGGYVEVADTGAVGGLEELERVAAVGCAHEASTAEAEASGLVDGVGQGDGVHGWV